MKTSNVIRSLVAVILAAAMLFGICACGGTDEPEFKTDEEFLVYVETNELASAVDFVSGMIGKAEAAEGTPAVEYKKTKRNITIGAELGDSLLSLLSTAIFAAPEVDLKWLSNISVASSAASNKDGDLEFSFDLLLGKKSVATVNVVYDANLETIYLQIPQLSENYIAVNKNEIADVIAGVADLLGFGGDDEGDVPFGDDEDWEIVDDWYDEDWDDEDYPIEYPEAEHSSIDSIIGLISSIDIPALIAGIDDAKLTVSEVSQLLTKYISVVLGELKVAKREKVAVKIGDIEKEYDALTVNFSENFIKALGNKLIETAKTDETLKTVYGKLTSLISSIVSSVISGDGEDDTLEIPDVLAIPTYDELLDMIKESVDEFKYKEDDEDFEYNPDDPIFSVTTYVDGYSVAARRINATTYSTLYEPDDSEYGYKTTTTATPVELFLGSATTDDGKEAIDFYVKEGDEYPLRISGNGTKKDSAFTGTVTLSCGGTELVDLIFTNFAVSSDAVKGSVEISFTDDAIAMLGEDAETIVSMFGSMISVKLDLDCNKDSAKASVSAIAGSSTILKLSLATGTENSNDDINTPVGTSLFEWLLGGLDFVGYAQKLAEAGVPYYITDLVTTLPDLIGF